MGRYALPGKQLSCKSHQMNSVKADSIAAFCVGNFKF